MLLIAVYAQYFFGFTICITSLFLVMLVLVQRGRGGGLTGALGGAGGQSAFGTKAGDLFTRITVGVASVWIILCAAAVFFLKDRALPDTGVGNRDNITIESPREPGGAAAITPASSASPAS
ncbi:MAG: preprotein translocase subunit SecG, partial [Planctomycetales bacterium]|nr:preprotein translocase subunit SecG [Planctomycetales bacterium]